MQPPLDRRWTTPAALVVTGLLLLGGILRVAGDPFGDSHDGRNGAVWATASRAIRVDGLLASRLGGVRSESVYANHPPLIAVETAAAEAIAGVHRWVTRSPAWLASIAALFLVWRIGRRLGLAGGPLAVGIAVAASSPLFLAYAAMLDTPVTSLPIGLLVVERWLAWRGGRPVRHVALAALAALAAVAGWQSAFLTGLVVVAGAVQRRWRPAGSVAAGLGLGVGAVLAWQLWVHGSLDVLVEQLRFRTAVDGGEWDVDLLSGIRNQAEWVVQLLNPVGLVGLAIGGLLLARDGGARRVVAGVTIGAVVGYDVLLSGGAFFHDYWSFWSVAPVALGVARAGEELVARWQGLHRATAVAASTLLLAAPVWAFVPSAPVEAQDVGVAAARLVLDLERPPDVAYGMADPTAWARYELGRFDESIDLGDPSRGCERSDEDGCVAIVNLDVAPRFAGVGHLSDRGPYAAVDGGAIAAVDADA